MMMSYVNNTVLVWVCFVLLALFCQSSVAGRKLCGRELADALVTMCGRRGFHVGKRNGRSIGSVYSRSTDRGGRDPNIHQTLHNYIKNHKSNQNVPNRLGGHLETAGDQTHKDLSYYKQKRFVLANLLSYVGITRPYNYTEEYLRHQADHLKKEQQESGSRDGVFLEGGLMSPGTFGGLSRRRRQAHTESIVDECCLRPCNEYTMLRYCAAPEDPEEEYDLAFLQSIFAVTSPPRLTTTPRPRIMSFARPAQINRGTGRPQSSFFYVRPDNRVTRRPLLIEQRRQQS